MAKVIFNVDFDLRLYNGQNRTPGFSDSTGTDLQISYLLSVSFC